MKFDAWTVVLLCRVPNAPALTEDASATLQDAHLMFLAARHDEGKLLIAGPAQGTSRADVAGICVYALATDQARAIAQEDPMVRAGQLRVEVLSWVSPADAIRPGPGRFPRSIRDVEGP